MSPSSTDQAWYALATNCGAKVLEQTWGIDMDRCEYAGFWIRAVAGIIDSLLLTVVTAPILISIYGMDYYADAFDPDVPMFRGLSDFVVSIVLPAIAVILFWIHRQATLGKMAISARVVNAHTGENPSTAQCIGRYFAYIPSVLALGIGILWVAFDNRKQGWHDKLAGTVVIRRTVAVEFHARQDAMD